MYSGNALVLGFFLVVGHLKIGRQNLIVYVSIYEQDAEVVQGSTWKFFSGYIIYV